MALRVASLDYLGTVASRLRKDAVTSNMDQKAIDRILREVGKIIPESFDHLYISIAVELLWNWPLFVLCLQTPGSDEIQQLQKGLLDYLDWEQWQRFISIGERLIKSLWPHLKFP